MHSAANSVTNVLVSDYFPLHIPHVDLLDHNLAIAIVATILLPLMWNLLGRLEYYTRIFSRLTIKRIIAVYLCAAVIAALSLYRTALIVVAIRSQQSLQTMDTPLFHALGGIIGILGFSFILGAYYQLGITGTYLGDYFGIFKEERITAFPFNLLDNPMYDGSSMMHLADAIL